MEANMIPFRHPGQERRRLSIFVAVLATLALVLAFFVVDGGRNWDRVHRFFSYGTEQVQISMDTAPGALGELDGRLVTAGAEGVTLYDKDGKVSFLAAASLTSPVVQGDGGYILAYDAGGTTIVLLDGKGEVRWEGSLPGPVYDADLTEDGYLCYVSAGSAVKSELQLGFCRPWRNPVFHRLRCRSRRRRCVRCILRGTGRRGLFRGGGVPHRPGGPGGRGGFGQSSDF